MAYFKLNTFNGIAPLIEPRLLRNEVGVTCENVNLQHGNLTALFPNSTHATLNASSITSHYQYKFGGTTYNLEFDDDVDPVPGPIADDAFDRLYWTGQTFPRMASSTQITTGGSGAYPRSSFRLGVEAPANAPSAATPTGTDDGTQIKYSTAYVYTFVTAFGEEGPPSDPSNVVTKVDGQSIVVTMSSTSGSKSDTNYTHKRLYRSNTGSNTTDFQFVTEVTLATTTFTDSKNNEALGEIIPSTFWIAPPDDNATLYPNGQMKGLTAVGNGIFAGFSGKRLCFSEPFLPHAWPVAYRVTLEDEIVGISMAGNVLFIGTKGTNYIASGTDPQAMAIQKLEAAEPLLYKRSLVDMGGYCMYSGPDGLIAVENGQVTNVTEQLISPAQWQGTYVVQSAGRHEGKYVGQNSLAAQTPTAIIYDPKGGMNALTTVDTLLSNLANTNRGFYTNPDTNQLFLISKPSSGNCTVEKFDDSANDNKRTATFKSKELPLPSPTSMNFVKVEADGYGGSGVRVKVFGDGTEIFDATITASGSVFSATGSAPTSFSATTILEPILRLPTGVHKVYQVEIISANTVHEVCLAESIDELRAV
tara:strand:- start:1738 stop:3501 length:1764 start_codon:yes stop_codon:yes gene_type:complete